MISPKASDSVLALDDAEEVCISLDPGAAEALMATLFARGSNGSGGDSGGERGPSCVIRARAPSSTCRGRF